MMKLVKLSPKRFFRTKKSPSDEAPSKSDPPSFASSSSSSSSDLKTAIGSATPQSVLPDSSDDLADAFRLMDRHNAGVVSRKELEALLSRLGSSSPDDEIVATMLNEVDAGGVISVEALASRVADAGSAEPSGDADELREVFEFFDANRDGKIQAEELLSFYAAIGDERCTLEECRRMIAGVDSNGDGFVCFEDFSRMMELQRV